MCSILESSAFPSCPKRDSGSVRSPGEATRFGNDVEGGSTVTDVKKIDHVAIAVRSIDESRKAFEEIYGARYLGQKENTEQQYIVAYFLMGESLITMLEGT